MKAKKIILSIMLGACVVSVLPQIASANTENAVNLIASEDILNIQQYVGAYGEVGEISDNSIFLKNSTNANKEILLNIGQDTVIVDAVSGLPVSVKDIKVSGKIYAYMGQAMTLSLPPMTNAKAIIVNIPQDFAVPKYIQVEAVKKNNDGSITVVADKGRYEATLDKTTSISPYLTRNIVTIDDIKVGSNILVWKKENTNSIQTKELPVKVKIEKCIIAAEDNSYTQVNGTKKWHKEDNNWYFIENGVQVKGWLKDNEKWYYLNSEGIMQTNWIKDKNKWYFLNEDGSMKTGWALVNGEYYYLKANGEMAENEYIDGYYVGSNGAWVK